MLRIAIAEDDTDSALELKSTVERCCRENGTEASIVHFPNGIELVENYCPVWDLLLLDIEMPLMDGMEAARRIRAADDSVLIIFITNMAQYAINGYEVGALDFVLKPVTYPQLSMKLRKVFAIMERKNDQGLMVAAGDITLRIPTAGILYIEVLDHQLVIHTDAGVDYTQRGTLREMESKLVGLPFFRCGQSYMVNLRQVTGMGKNTVLVGSASLPISRSYKKEFLRRLSDYMGGGAR